MHWISNIFPLMFTELNDIITINSTFHETHHQLFILNKRTNCFNFAMRFIKLYYMTPVNLKYLFSYLYSINIWNAWGHAPRLIKLHYMTLVNSMLHKSYLCSINAWMLHWDYKLLPKTLCFIKHLLCYLLSTSTRNAWILHWVSQNYFIEPP